MSSRRERAAQIRRLLATEGAAVEANTKEFNRGRYEAFAELDDYEALKDRARAIKEEAIERLPALIDEVEESVEARGGHVHLAGDAADAREYVAEVSTDAGVETVVKSKSMTSEEMDFNEALSDAGADVWETDLGEFVVQIADESPSHLVGPAIHRSRESIAELFAEVFDPEMPLETADDLTRFAREFLAERFAEADLGMTGANFVAADTGTVALVTSEGNARKTVAATDVHVAVAGVEKLLPSVADLHPFLALLARSASGQALSSYVTFLTPPGDAPTMDFDADALGDAGDREFHLVLLDNGRTEMREDDQLRETLYCVRCGACANSCANFQHVGGHAFGGETYTGGIGTGWEAGVHGLDSAAEFNDLCTGCTRCVNQCPVRIDIPWINTVVRDRVNRGADPGSFDHLVDGLVPDEESAGTPLGKRLFGNVGTLARVGSATAPASNWLAARGPARWVAERTLGIDRRRDLPEFSRRTLRDWFDERGGTRVGDPDGEVVLYPDVYTNHVNVERGQAAVRLLEALGVAVRIPAVPESGRAPLSQGMVATAERQARAVRAALDPHVEAGREVVVVEPSTYSMLRRDYSKLLDVDAFERLAAASFELLEYVDRRLEAGTDVDGRSDADELADELADTDGLSDVGGEAVAYHPHCQARTLGVDEPTVRVLERAGCDVVVSAEECCGMAGSFGYKAEYYDLSVAVGESLAEWFRDAGAGRVPLASGTSCLDQLDGLLERSPRHPAEFLVAGE